MQNAKVDELEKVNTTFRLQDEHYSTYIFHYAVPLILTL